jgi:hypothetical protein
VFMAAVGVVALAFVAVRIAGAVGARLRRSGLLGSE